MIGLTHEQATARLEALERVARANLSSRAWLPVRCCTPDFHCRLTASISEGYMTFQYLHHSHNIDRKAAINVLMLEEGNGS